MEKQTVTFWFSGDPFGFIPQIFIQHDINFDRKICFLEMFSDKVCTVFVYTFYTPFAARMNSKHFV